MLFRSPQGEIEAEISKIKKQQAAIGAQISDLQKNSNSNNPDETATLEQLNSQYQQLQSQLYEQQQNLYLSTISGKYFQEDRKTIKMKILTIMQKTVLS